MRPGGPRVHHNDVQSFGPAVAVNRALGLESWPARASSRASDAEIKTGRRRGNRCPGWDSKAMPC